jgi:curved DNA-binding protein CbpA
MNTDPFAVLGLPARPDLPDEQVRAAWRAIAAATHPDRADGGDLARYTAASAAYAELRTGWGRSEAHADLAEQAGLADGPVTAPLPVTPAHGPPPGIRPPAPAGRCAGIPGPDPAGTPAPPAHPRRDRRRAVPGRPAADPRHRRRPGRHHRHDHLVRADRTPGPGTPARTVNTHEKSRCLRRGLGLQDGPGPHPALPPYSGWG